MSINKKIIKIALAFLLASCQSSNILDDTEDKNSTTFSFVKMEYLYDENSIIQEDRLEQPLITLDNGTHVTQSYVFDPAKHFYEKSRFWSSDTRAFKFADENVIIKTPSVNSSRDNIQFDQGKWTYADFEQKKRPSEGSTQTITVDTGNRMLLYPTLTTKTISLTYHLYLKGVEHGEEVVVKGYWSGTFLIDYDISVSLVPLLKS